MNIEENYQFVEFDYPLLSISIHTIRVVINYYYEYESTLFCRLNVQLDWSSFLKLKDEISLDISKLCLRLYYIFCRRLE